MSPDLIDPEGIPVFIGDLEQLSTDALLLTAEASAFRFAGADVHGKFQGLSACYSAPEAEQLFATTAPVAAKADKFADDLEKVGAALSAYEAEIQPLVAKLKSLRARAENFRADIAGDDHWLEDNDKVQLNNDLFYDVNVTQMAFWQAERTCHNKITALVHGTTLIVEDGAQERLVKRGTSTYGFTKDLLDQSDDLPWGRTVEKERHGLDWLGHQIVEFGKGFFVDGVWGTIRGLGTLVGFDGLDAMGEAWTHLSKLATGIAITLTPLGTAYWAAPDDKLPSYLRESRQTVTETGKALVAYDQWGKNPARAGGAVTFNALTTIFTGGAGSATKSGAVARTIGALGKTGRWVDPMTYVGKAARFGTVKVADLFGSLKNFKAGAYTDVLSGAGKVQPDGSVLRTADDVPVVVGNHIEWPDGTRLNLDDGSVIRADGTHAAAKVELSAADRAMLERSLPHGDAALVGAGDGAAAHVGGDSAARVGGDTTAHTGGNASGHAGDTSGSPGTSHAADSVAPRSASGSAENGHAAAGAGGHGGDSPDDLGRTGDDTLDGGADGVHEPDPNASARQVSPARPSFMRDGDTPYGPRGTLTPDQIKEIQVYRANHEPGYFKKYYMIDGRRLNTTIKDESGFVPVQLDVDPATKIKTAASDAPPPIPHKHVAGSEVTRGRHEVRNDDTLRTLDDEAAHRRSSIDYSGSAERHRDLLRGSADDFALRDVGNEYKAAMHERTKAAEAFGEAVAEHQVISELYPNSTKETLYGPANGNDQFDQVWRRPDGGFAVVEAKSTTNTDLGSRRIPPEDGGGRAMQGTREYFLDILKEMRLRGREHPSEVLLADELEHALAHGKVDYILVKGKVDGAEYAGYEMYKFDIG
ncbi:hypothetical protein [Streptomyces sp. HUAS TT20]|uniref:hypothetical protein n=1 Tax=Streptomyces sp. HUAS TT20 TaxID=3447509 RepID=UPI0021D8CBFE|nr:hypothetical protein [Streptomyces sp. HUAS 15-9]UXY27679.1 hypothetical protein N8I87_14565 [Streptomyces sp. HUAS 15-9]